MIDILREMKKIACMLLVTFSSLIAIGQNVPNSGFETWSSVSTFSIDQWVTAGEVSRTTDAKEGGYAIRLDNVLSTNSRAFVASGPFGRQGIQGIPYNEQPLSVRFYSKYDLALGDIAQVAALFYLQGNFVAFANITIEGSSMDTFTYFSVPIDWQVSTVPDSVAIIFSSIELDSNNVQGDGYIIFDDFHFASISTRNKAVPNGNFNTWGTQSREALTGWFTTDDYIESFGGGRPNPPIVSKNNTAKSGSYAIELKNRVYGQDTLPGIMFTGSDISSFERPAFAVNRKWKFLEGYYQFSPENRDTASIVAFMFRNGVPVGSAQGAIVSAKSDYTYFAFNIDYLIDIVPDSATVFISNANPDAPRGAGTRLLIDDVRFTDQNLGVFTLHHNRLNVYPNPFKDEIHLSGIDFLEDAQFVIYDAGGKVFREGTCHNNDVIDMRDASAGVYFLHIEGNHVVTDKILLKE